VLVAALYMVETGEVDQPVHRRRSSRRSHRCLSHGDRLACGKGGARAFCTRSVILTAGHGRRGADGPAAAAPGAGIAAKGRRERPQLGHGVGLDGGALVLDREHSAGRIHRHGAGVGELPSAVVAVMVARTGGNGSD